MNDYAYRDPYGPGGALGFPAPGRLS
jgi:hypothetical protein